MFFVSFWCVFDFVFFSVVPLFSLRFFTFFLFFYLLEFRFIS